MDADAGTNPLSPGSAVDWSRVRIALVHDWLTGQRGGEKCLEVLCRAFPLATIHTLIHRSGALGPTIEAMPIRTSPLQAIPGVLRHYRKLLPLMPLATRSWDVGPVDLVVSLSHCVAKAVHVPKGVPHVCYCFTPMRYAWDGRETYLEAMRAKPLRRWLATALLDRLRAWDRASAAGVTDFVAISKTVRGRIERAYGRSSVVISPPVRTDYFTPTAGPRDGPYLCVSALVPYKKVEHAVLACSKLGRPLVVIGAGPERARLERQAGSRVRFLGWATDETIRDHFRRCRALLFPGEEDFGIVPAEALACGAPVIALGRGGAAETVTDEVGRLYDDPTPEGLAAAIESWEASGRPCDAARARTIAEGLSETHFRDRLLDHLAFVLARSARDRPAAIPAHHLGHAAARPTAAGGRR